MGTLKARFGYADDIALVGISPLSFHNTALSDSLQEALD